MNEAKMETMDSCPLPADAAGGEPASCAGGKRAGAGRMRSVPHCADSPGGWNRSNSAIITVSVKDEQNLGWYQMAYRMNDGDWTDCEQLFDKGKAEIAVHENGTFTFASPTRTGIRLKKAPASLSLTEAHRP